MLYCIKISAVLFLQNYCVLLQGVYNIIVDNTGVAAPGWRNTDMTKQEMLQLKMTATRVRMGVIEATHGAGCGHPGGSLSAADVLTYLYFREMRIDPEQPQDPNRDRFVLSKGHCAPGLYATLAERGFFPVADLPTLRHSNSYLQGHPNCLLYTSDAADE